MVSGADYYEPMAEEIVGSRITGIAWLSLRTSCPPLCMDVNSHEKWQSTTTVYDSLFIFRNFHLWHPECESLKCSASAVCATALLHSSGSGPTNISTWIMEVCILYAWIKFSQFLRNRERESFRGDNSSCIPSFSGFRPSFKPCPRCCSSLACLGEFGQPLLVVLSCSIGVCTFLPACRPRRALRSTSSASTSPGATQNKVEDCWDSGMICAQCL